MENGRIASNVEIGPHTNLLEIVNEMWERGFKFGKLPCRSDATEFSSGWIPSTPPFVAMGWSGRERCQAVGTSVKRGEFLFQKQNYANVVASHQPWLRKDG